MAPYVDDARHAQIGYLSGQIEMYERTSAKDGHVVAKKSYKDVKKKPDPKDWLTYELRVRKDEIISLLNGHEIGRHPRGEGLEEGYIAIRVQCAKVEVRRVAVIKH